MHASPRLNLYYSIKTYPQREEDVLLQLEARISGKFFRNYYKELKIFVKMPWSDETAIDGKKYHLWLRFAAKDQLMFGLPTVQPDPKQQ